MADIRRYPFLRHFRGTATEHVVHVDGGSIRHEGVGLSFWFRPRRAVLSIVPADDRELSLVFHAPTRDFQDVTVQATVTFRFDQPATVARRLDFGIDPETGVALGDPLDQVGQLLTELAQGHALDLLGRLPLADVLVSGIARTRATIAEGLAADERLAASGIAVLDVRVVAIRPEADVERALRTPVREEVQAEADRAGYERRALAVERERAIAENELANEIELAVREERLVEQHGVNDRRRAEEEAAAAEIATTAEAERTRLLAAAQADHARVVGEGEAAAEAARVGALADVDRMVLLALVAREVAGSLPEIGSLAITPDLVTSALAGLAGGRGD